MSLPVAEWSSLSVVTLLGVVMSHHADCEKEPMTSRSISLIGAAFVALAAPSAVAETLLVPQMHATIQAAVGGSTTAPITGPSASCSSRS